VRTEGNPFFLEESVRTLVDTGVLGGERGAYHLAQAPPPMPIPANVQTVLAARIDRLPPTERRLLQTAAVIGTEVPVPLLQAIAELPEMGMHDGLRHLQAAEFLYESRLFPEHTYTFKHALTHEVAYSSLLQERRRVLHTRIVEVVEALYPDRLTEQVERLAHHALRGEVWEKALAYYRQAQALAEALGMRPLQAHCHGSIGTLFTQLGQREQARTELTAAIALYRTMAMTFWLLRTEATLAQVDTEDHRHA
jgi:predicted ATPase